MNNKAMNYLKENSGSILSFGAIIGAVTGSVLAYKAGYKTRELEFECEDTEALEKAKKRLIWPVLGTLMATGTLVIGADILNRKQKSDLMAVAMAGGSAFSAYRQEVIKRYGAEVDADICDTVSKYAECHYMAPDIPDKLWHCVLKLGVDELPDYEFDAYERDVIHAEMHFNRNYILGMGQNVAELLTFLDIKEPNKDVFGDEDMYGWAINDSEIYFIDFMHKKIDENTLEIWPVFAPWYDFDHLDMFGNEY